jgi:hypothetical protein
MDRLNAPAGQVAWALSQSMVKSSGVNVGPYLHRPFSARVG